MSKRLARLWCAVLVVASCAFVDVQAIKQECPGDSESHVCPNQNRCNVEGTFLIEYGKAETVADDHLFEHCVNPPVIDEGNQACIAPRAGSRLSLTQVEVVKVTSTNQDSLRLKFNFATGGYTANKLVQVQWSVNDYELRTQGIDPPHLYVLETSTCDSSPMTAGSFVFTVPLDNIPKQDNKQRIDLAIEIVGGVGDVWEGKLTTNCMGTDVQVF
jgi:hypothetical protein